MTSVNSRARSLLVRIEEFFCEEEERDDHCENLSIFLSDIMPPLSSGDDS